jgi:hypothetical protein
MVEHVVEAPMNLLRVVRTRRGVAVTRARHMFL